MADPLLNTLCAICHTNPPKYTCPACSLSTCSLPCSQRHKAWADCSGRRDPTVFKPLQQLKTPAGVDHDFNFLSAIERARERAQRELIEERGIFTENSLGRDLDEEEKWRREWFGDEVKLVKQSGVSGGLPGRRIQSDGEEQDDEAQGRTKKAFSLNKLVRERLEELDINVIHVPVGMSRQRDNTTAWNRKSRTINWCVEWVFYDHAPTNSTAISDAGDEQQQHPQQPQPLRIRHKALENVPLYRAFGAALAYHRFKTTKKRHSSFSSDYDSDDPATLPRRKKRVALIKELQSISRITAAQHFPSTTFSASTPYPTQNPHTAAWGLDRGATTTSWDADDAINAIQREGWRFYLQRHAAPGTQRAAQKELIPLDGAKEGLGRALQGRTVMEYPTVFVLPPRVPGVDKRLEWLPEGWVRGSTQRKESKKQKKRKAPEDGGVPRGGSIAGRGRGTGERGRGRGRGRGVRFEISRRGKNEELEEGEIGSRVTQRRRGRGQQREVQRAPAAAAGVPNPSEGMEVEMGMEMGIEMDVDNDQDDESKSTPLLPSTDTSLPRKPPKPSLGLVDYGSSEDEDEDDGQISEDDEGIDLASLKPEDPELVGAAIREIVGLFTT